MARPTAGCPTCGWVALVSEMNRFIPAASVADGHVIMMRATKGGCEMLYSGPLAGVTETIFAQAELSLVNPDTLRWIKDKADAAIRLNPRLAF